MAKQTINIGTVANDGTGDPLRTAFNKVNQNFTELYNSVDNIPTDISDLTDNTNLLFDGQYSSLTGAPDVSLYLTANNGVLNIDSIVFPDSTTQNTAFTGTQTQISNWNTAYSWGDHAVEGYLTSIPTTISSNVVSQSTSSVIVDSVNSNIYANDVYLTNIVTEPGQSLRLTTTNSDNTSSINHFQMESDPSPLTRVEVDMLISTSSTLKFQSGGTIDFSGSVVTGTMGGSLIPSTDATYDLGSPTNQWGSLYVSGNTIFIGGNPISINEDGDFVVSNAIVSANNQNFVDFKVNGFDNMKIGTYGPQQLEIHADFGGDNYTWTFGSDGGLTVSGNVYGRLNDRLLLAGSDSLVPAFISIPSESTADTVPISITNPHGYIEITGDLIPSTDTTYDLGSPTNQWRSLYVSANTIFVGGTPISVDPSGNLLVSGITNSTSEENLRVETGKISLNSSKSDSLYTDTGGSYASASWSGNNIDFTAVDDIYFETLLERFFDHFDGSGLPWNVGYSNITVRINDTQTLTVTGAEDLGGGDWRVTVAETPDSDPTAVTSAEFLYDFLSTLEFDRDNNSYAIALDDSNFRINTRRDIRLEAGDDIYIDGRSNMRLRNYSRTSGITIETDFNDGEYEWLFDEDGMLTTPGDIIVAGDITGTSSSSTLVLKAEPSSNTYIQLNDNVDSVISTVANLEIITDASNTPKTWTFDTSGGLTFPDTTAQTTAFTLSPTLNVLKIDDGVHEKFQVLADAANTVTHDCSEGHIFYHTSPDDDWTVNLTNLNLDSGYATTVTIVIVQGGTGYYPSALEIGGSAQTINWQGNSTPTPSTNRTDVVSFSIINNGGTYTVLGQLTGF